MTQLSLEQLLHCGLGSHLSAEILPQINHLLATLPAVECWQQITHDLLKPEHPWALHQLLYQTVYADWAAEQGPPPAWVPTVAEIQRSNLTALIKQLKVDSYKALHTWSVQHRADFWQLMIQRLGIRLRHPYRQIMDLSAGIEAPNWLVGAKLNIAESCFQAAPTARAIAFQPEEGKLTTWTYAELEALTNRVANGLSKAGFQPGAAIAIVLPMIPEAVAIYLGIIKAGCVVVSIADSFAIAEIALRLQIAQAQAVFTQIFIQRSGKQLPLYSKVIAAQAPEAIVLEASRGALARSQDRSWEQFLSDDPTFTAIPTAPAAQTNILFSSGTTGEPKAIPWTQTTPIKCAADGHLHQDIQPGDVVAWPTNLGWMMGPWLIYASLINQATIALYGGSPSDRGFGNFIQQAQVTMLGVVPSLVSTWKATGCMQGLNWSSIRAFSSTGECSNPQDMLFLMSLAGYKPVIEYCGGTEIGGGYITGTVIQPCAPATFTTPALGLDIVLDQDDCADKGEGFILPPAIGLSTELLNRDHHQVYFANTPKWPTPLRRHGDQFQRFANGYYRMLGRVDDTMNLSGIKVSAVEIEQVLNTIPGIIETAAIALSPPEGGPSHLIVYAVLEPGVESTPATLKATFQAQIKQQLNPLFKISQVLIVETLPRTASNKMMRRLLRDHTRLNLSDLLKAKKTTP